MQFDTVQGAVLWALRIALVTGGGALQARGYGDEDFWKNAIGAAMLIAGAGWSYYERRRALATVPAPVAQAAAVAAAVPQVPLAAAGVLATVAQASGVGGTAGA